MTKERKSEIDKKWRDKNRAAVRKKQREYYSKNRLMLLEKHKKYAENNKERLRLYRQGYWKQEDVIKKKKKRYNDNKDGINLKRRAKNAETKDCRNGLRREERKKNPSKLNEIKRKWVAKNWAKVYDRQKRWRKENKERFAETSRINTRKYYQRNKEKCIAWAKNDRVLNPEKHKERLKRYRKNNPEVIRAIETRKRKAGKVSPQNLKQLMVDQKGCCFYCGIDISSKYHIDHYTPITKGGTSDIDNIVLSCPPCNLRKHTKHGDLFISEMKSKKCA